MPSRKNAQPKNSTPSTPNNGAACPPPSAILKVRDSSVHGRGVYAMQTIRKGTRIIEYTGKRMAWEDVPNDPDDPHTMIFSLDDGQVINPAIDGNEARWINHSCDPNCEALGKGDRIFIHAMRDIWPGEELSYDYSLDLDEPITKKLKAEYKCHCGAPHCRGTMLDIG